MENELDRRAHRTPEQRAQILADYRQSGLTQKVFAAQAGIGCSTLSFWLRRANGSQSTHLPAFIPVPNLLPAGGRAAPYRIEFPRGLAVSVTAGFRAEELSALLQVVQRL
jgi:transposase-like protein